MQNQVKSFWEKPEGKTGKIFLVVLALVFGWLFFQILPFLLLAVTNTIYLVILVAILLGIGFVLLDPNFQNFVAFAYKGAMRKITGALIELDPIAIIETYLSDLRKHIGTMEEQMDKLKGQVVQLRRVISEHEKEIQEQTKYAKKAKEMNNEGQFLLASRKVDRLVNSNQNLQGLHDKIESLYKVLNKMADGAKLSLEDLSDEIDLKKRERKAILAGHSAFRSALKVLKGDQSKLDMFNSAMEFMAEDLGNRIGEMERFMEQSNNFISTLDIQNGVAQEESLKLIESMEAKSYDFFLDGLRKNSNVIDVVHVKK